MLLWLGLLLPAVLVAMRLRTIRERSGMRALGKSTRVGGRGGWGAFAAAVCLLIALVGPRWGRIPGLEPATGHEVVVAVDVSRSMAAEDAVPDRLGAAIEAAKGLIRAIGREPEGRVAVVAFAGRGAVRCPMTSDLGAAIEAVDRLRPASVQPGGSDLAEALAAALEAFPRGERVAGRTIVLFSDGEDLAGRWTAMPARLKEARVVVHAVAVGDAERGHPIPTASGKSLTYEGRTVETRRQDAPFEAIAGATGGAVVRLGTSTVDLASLYETRIAPGEKAVHASLRPPERTDRSPVFLFAALACLTLGTWRRPRAVVIGLVIAATAAGAGGTTAEGLVNAGMAAYRAGRLDEAAAAFAQAVRSRPDAAIAAYDLGAVRFRQGRFVEAETAYLAARKSALPALRQKIDFALGNTRVAMGDPQTAIRRYDACLATPATGPESDALRTDASENRRFAQRQLPPGDEEGDREGGKGTDSGGDDSGTEPRPPDPGGTDATKSQSPSDAAGEAPKESTLRTTGGGVGSTPAGNNRPADASERLNEALTNARNERSRRSLGDDGPQGGGDTTSRKDW